MFDKNKYQNRVKACIVNDEDDTCICVCVYGRTHKYSSRSTSEGGEGEARILESSSLFSKLIHFFHPLVEFHF